MAEDWWSDGVRWVRMLKNLLTARLAQFDRQIDWQGKGIRPCIPDRKSRGRAVQYDKRRYKRRNRIEMMFGRRKDWCRIATR